MARLMPEGDHLAVCVIATAARTGRTFAKSLDLRE
jgi:hypothetical protein